MACLNIPVGVSDFAEIRKNGYYYVDKSGLIEELLRTTATKVTLITRPRRFGKTLGMNMLAEFFDIRKDSRALFEGLEIDENTELCNRWMNQWPTIFFSLRRVDGLDFSGAYDMLCSVIIELCDSHRYLLDSEKISPYDRSVIKNILNFDASESDIKNSLLSHRLSNTSTRGGTFRIFAGRWNCPSDSKCRDPGDFSNYDKKMV